LTVGKNSEFILFTRNNLYYNLKFSLSNILYKYEKLIPVLKLHSLLKNIYLFVPKRLLKPHPYINYTYRIIQARAPYERYDLLSGGYAVEQNGVRSQHSILPFTENTSPRNVAAVEKKELLTSYNLFFKG
jgi:hypothetical protein